MKIFVFIDSVSNGKCNFNNLSYLDFKNNIEEITLSENTPSISIIKVSILHT